jgi:subtilisin family serine protease
MFTMRIKHVFLTLTAIWMLVSCGTTKHTQTTKPEEVKDTPLVWNMTPRKTPLTKEQQKRWAHMDLNKDSIPGMSVDRAYEFLQDKKPSDVIVAVIDSGIDIEHEEFQGEVWNNEDEIPGNGKDDDNNGYIDDINGWNFLGGKKGQDAPMRLEITRIVAKLAPKYKGKTADQIPEADKKEFEYYKKLAEEVENERKSAEGQKTFYKGMLNTLKKAYDVAVKGIGKKDFTAEELSKFNSDDANFNTAKPMMMRFLQAGMTIEDGIGQIQEAVDYFKSKSDYMYNLDFNGRLTGDNPDDINDFPYGNNLVMGSKDKEIHGTHVSGIICALRNNGKGVNGVTNHVKLMPVRAIPDGDEADKDVALAIRYAVDNGAKVINMSFGKKYSPHKEWVLDAIKYAADHDVLIVKAAGNNGMNVDQTLHYPTDSPEDGAREISDNVISVGASTQHLDENICATFSNYGKKRVDVFAPGYKIYNTFPKNEYKAISGTSMASPQVAGVAALIRAYYPQLTAKEVKEIIMKSGVKLDMTVKQPTEDNEVKMVPFDSLSRTGRIVNAYAAVKMADAYVKAKK